MEQDAMEARRLYERERERLFYELLEDISACGRIGGMMEGIAREIQLLEWNKEDFPTLDKFSNGVYAASLGLAIEALSWRAQDNLDRYEKLTKG